MECLKVFHRDILTVRSHQWKYYVEPYSGCAFQCAYCLYYGSESYIRRLRPQPDLLPAVERDLAAMPHKQIVYVGATADPYQALERKTRWTRQILQQLIAHDIPVVILTKSPLILRDADLLLELHRRRHVMVQFTVLTTNEDKARVLEPGAPTVAQRLDTASRLAGLGIPVHFHLSPVIPGLYDGDEMNATVRSIAGHGGRCIYSNILGMRTRNTDILFDAVARISPRAAAALASEYARGAANGKNVYSPVFGRVYREMARLNRICRDNHIAFISEFIPGLDVFDASTFEQGIFRFGLPAVYQMAGLFETPFERQGWERFRAGIRKRYAALDEEYLNLVKTFWDDGSLFENTAIACETANGDHLYYRSDRLNLRESVLTWD
ncbi:MAG: radical SAM protein [Acidobacteriia bacterium]|nr:radical SAM protein [Terriglobia bacterium]